jgi:hypothetical protein
LTLVPDPTPWNDWRPKLLVSLLRDAVNTGQTSRLSDALFALFAAFAGARSGEQRFAAALEAFSAASHELISEIDNLTVAELTRIVARCAEIERDVFQGPHFPG